MWGRAKQSGEARGAQPCLLFRPTSPGMPGRGGGIGCLEMAQTLPGPKSPTPNGLKGRGGTGRLGADNGASVIPGIPKA